MISLLLTVMKLITKIVLKTIFRSFFVMIVFFDAGILAALPSTNEPVAIIEDITNGPGHISKFDYLYPGHVIDLGRKGVLSLIYFQTCLRESIRGGKVTIQDRESDVEGSIRISQRLSGCDLGDHQHQPSGRRTSAAMVFRGSTPVLTIDHLSPRFKVSGDVQSISIIELPSSVEIIRLRPSNMTVDLSDHNILLVPGKIYRVASNSGYVIIRIDKEANQSRGANAIQIDHRLKNGDVIGNQ